jgi:diguanylate cyclase (GGDEF)-like protein
VRALGGALALAFAALALTGLATRLIDARTAVERSQRLNDLSVLVQLADRESHQLAVKPKPIGAATAMQIHDVVSRLGRSSPDVTETARVLIPAGTALALAEHRRNGQAASAFARVSSAAETALLTEETAPIPVRSGLLARLEDWSALVAAVIGALLGIGALFRLQRRKAVMSEGRAEELAAEARTDSLTGLGNLRAFQETLSKAIADRASTNTPFVLLAIDLDGLKQINDTDGHLAGDAYIKSVAECLRATVGAQGAVHRTGGDEFMVILPGRRNWDGLGLARQIEERSRKVIGRRALSIGLTESTGTEGRHLLVAQADLALYEAKRTGLNAVVFNPGLAKPAAAARRRSDTPGPEQRALAAALARAVDAKDMGMQSHCETVAQLSVAIGERLGLAGSELERLRIAGLLHDVGKIGVADAILQKPDELDGDEHSAMASHVEIGHAILLAAELPVEAEWILHHHEHFDGRGYPAKKRADEIPLGSRIIAVADAFEAMTSDRPYRPGVPAADALAELQRLAGRQFDGRCVDVLVELVGGTAAGRVEQLVERPADPASRPLDGNLAA